MRYLTDCLGTSPYTVLLHPAQSVKCTGLDMSARTPPVGCYQRCLDRSKNNLWALKRMRDLDCASLSAIVTVGYASS